MLPITEMLEDKIGYISDRVEYEYLKYEIVPQIRELEEAQQNKAKEEERERILEILKVTHFRSYNDEQVCLNLISTNQL